MAELGGKKIILAGLKGEKGDGLEIKKYYDDVETMQADYSNADIAVGDSVAIKNTLDLYVKGETQFEYVGTIKGEKGDSGTESIQYGYLGSAGDGFIYPSNLNGGQITDRSAYGYIAYMQGSCMFCYKDNPDVMYVCSQMTPNTQFREYEQIQIEMLSTQKIDATSMQITQETNAFVVFLQAREGGSGEFLYPFAQNLLTGEKGEIDTLQAMLLIKEKQV